MKTLLSLTVFLGVAVFCTAVLGSSTEEKLMKKILAKADTISRPVDNANDALTVKFGLEVTRASVMEDLPFSADIRLTTWFKLMWNDFNLVWDPEQFDGIKSIRIPAKFIWKPDIALYNGLEAATVDDVMVVVSSDGSVIYIPTSVTKVNCPKNGDVLQCQPKFGSWTYSSNEIDLQFFDKPETSTDFYDTREFEVTDKSAVRNERKYDCCPEKYTDMTFNVFLTRK
jgi:hypothetical protein